jgi:carboxylesterase
VLCLHGLSGTPWDVRHPAEVLAAHGFRCAGPLLPGHGTDPAELARTPARAWLEAALAAHDALAARHSRVYVLGLSMGGLLALALCQQRAVRGAVLLATPLFIPARLRLPVRLLHRVVRSVPRIPGIADPLARDANPGYRRMPLPAVYSLLGLQREVRAGLGAVRQPLLLVYSAADRTVGFENAGLLRSSVASARVELLHLERSGHVLTVDLERELIAQTIARFLAELESPGV